MSNTITRLPALPLIVNDPYFSIWCPGDKLTDCDTAHWAGAVKPMRGTVKIDNVTYRFLGLGKEKAMDTIALNVTPTATESVFYAGGVRLTLRFTTPLLLDQPEILSMPITYVDITAESDDGEEHKVAVKFFMSSQFCYSGEKAKPTLQQQYEADGMQIAFIGQLRQGLLNHSGDHTTIDWGYLYLAARAGVSANTKGLTVSASGKVRVGTKVAIHALAAYDDVASINYFGKICPAYYARGGKTIRDALKTFHDRETELKAACEALDKQLLADAGALGGEDYQLIVSAAYRHTIGAHKLIADERGDMIFLSKENDSNGCIGTVDVSYPSIPLFLLYNPEFVRGMCRPVLKFAQMPVWTYDFAPHDVGRYPHATGQVYGVNGPKEVFTGGPVHPPYYMYPADADAYKFRSQMPVEESGNMLLMLYAAAKVDGDYTLIREHIGQLSGWVKYLIEYGEDPGEQLCTDDFAGHLAHNINLSAKAICGVAAYALIQKGLGDDSAYAEYMEKARVMAKSWYERANAGGYTYLTFDQQGWSMKYNMVWDRLLNLKLLPDSFYREETESYLERMNEYGLPLDSRADYTKSDWILWSASMADGPTFRQLIAPIAKFLKESESRVAFSDWYDTKTGKYVAFIGRSVQGGLYMPLLARKWRR